MHAEWDSKEMNVKSVSDYTVNITKTMKNILKESSLKNIEYYPTLGNHDVWPANNQDFSKEYNSPVINLIYKNWISQGWLN